MGEWTHRLSEVDLDSRHAICSTCGPVEIRLKGISRTGRQQYRCAEVVRQDNSRWPSTREGKVRWKTNNPEKVAAHRKVEEAVRHGVLVRPEACSRCGETKRRIHGHHADYDKPLEVEWLCPICHAVEHS